MLWLGLESIYAMARARARGRMLWLGLESIYAMARARASMARAREYLCYGYG